MVSEKQEDTKKIDNDSGFFSTMKKLASETTEKAVKASSDLYESAKESI
ncbi:hypothetical protein GCM10023116_21050 [Kistimonas scapharcae]|uniref:Uncharacterized protein n=1 Tax=Kistimonas scapharcae TaxID=1036133 RepID=A0ABP8V1E2_9GAMM